MFGLFNNVIANEPKPTTTTTVASTPAKPVSNGYKFNFDLSFLGEFVQISLFKENK